ncbi:MBL fold metallo-hydrolase [Almyronema epifaneia]|uniref:MBL fold metallo-hydrolase n=1 Tax=Almyronema epifaneia S1 TaxID=2991925 RepID=A0ABW6IH60_9CYAN
MTASNPDKSTKAPRLILDGVFAFPPNRETMGGTAYFIVENDSSDQAANILVDCPAWTDTTQAFLADQGGVRWLFLTHRGAIAQVKKMLQTLSCQVIIQEQEAYLLPNLAPRTFHQTDILSPQSRVFWTPGYSPGSACLYHQRYGGILFSGRHLLPTPTGQLQPLRFAKTFHWPRQLSSLEQILADFSPETLQHVCPGANTGFLRGAGSVKPAYQQLQKLDLNRLRETQVLL